MLAEIRKIFRLHRYHNDRGNLWEFQREHNYRSFSSAAVIAIFISSLFCAQHFFFPGKTINPMGSIIYLYIFLLITIVSAIFLGTLFSLHKDSKWKRQERILIYLYSFIFVAIASFTTAIDLFDQRDFTAYLLTVLSFSIIISASPIIYGIMNLWSFSILIFFVSFLHREVTFDLILSIFAIAIVSLLMGGLIQFGRINHNILTYNLQEMNERLRELSFRDPLTGLYNRRFLVEFLDNKIALCARNKEHLSLMMLDIDHFKKVNDKLGHPVGDSVLKEVAIILESAIRDSDIVARYGGEEFVLVLPGASLADGKMVGQRILENCNAHGFSNVPWQVTLSAGVAELTADDDSTSLFAKADSFLYMAKDRGRNQIVGRS